MWHGRNLRNREKEILFVDLRTWSQNIYEKKYVKLTEEQIADVCKIYFDWQTLDTAGTPAKYEVPELYRSVGFEEIKSKNFSLVPSRYIEFVDRDTELDYETALSTAGEKVRELLTSQSENNKKLVDAFKVLGYDAE